MPLLGSPTTMRPIILSFALVTILLGCATHLPGSVIAYGVQGGRYELNHLNVYAVDHGRYFEIGADGCGEDWQGFVLMVDHRGNQDPIVLSPYNSLIEEPVLVRIRHTSQTQNDAKRSHVAACKELPLIKALSHQIKYARLNPQVGLYLFFDKNMDLKLKILDEWSTDSQRFPAMPKPD